MSVLTRYLLRSHLGPFLFALGTLTGLLLVNTVARRFEELAGKGLELAVIGEVFLLSLPHIVALTLPMAVLVAVLYTFSQLAAENEITALKASGVNLVRLLVPLVVVASILTGGMIWFNDRILPETNHKLKNLLIDIGRKAPTLELKEQVINEIPSEDLRTRYYLQASTIEPATNRLQDVVIWDLSTPGRMRVVYADSGRMSFNQDQTDLFLLLRRGRVHELNTAEPQIFQRLFFEEQRLRIQGVGTQFERTFDAGFRSDREMSIGMLAAEVEESRTRLRDLQEEAVAEATESVRRLLGMPPASSGEAAAGGEAGRLPTGRATLQDARTGNGAVFRDPAASANLSPYVSGMMPGSSDLATRQTATRLRTLENRASTAQFRVNQYRVEYHKKYAIPFACIVFVLIGAPLAIRFPRGGAGMVIAISLTIFSVYYAALIGGESLGDRGAISPIWAMWAPNVFFLILGIWGLARIGRETSTTRGGGWDDLLYSLKGVALAPFRVLRKRAA